MSQLSYETAVTLLYDPVTANRAVTRSGLYNLGFRNVECVGELAALEKSIQDPPPPDLVLCEIQDAEAELCQVIQNLRRGTGGYNPFLVIIVTTWQKSGPAIKRVIDSGADDLLLRPFSATVLADRIRTHVERRKGFVVTSDYIGPDRRVASARPSNAELFDPPNSLRMKVKDRMTADEVAGRLDVEIKLARDRVVREKLKRDAFQICVLWRLMEGSNPQASRYSVDQGKFKVLARSVAGRCAGTDFSGAVPWCEAAVAAMEGLEFGVERGPAMQMLGHAAMNLNQVFTPGRPSADLLSEIDATVAIIHARDQVTVTAV
ncbi:MAG TPA: hypothetical protein VLV55_05775 [Rhizomicrobium sp.]|nr:hypothetical protein [Rhizomicrobium sp.]